MDASQATSAQGIFGFAKDADVNGERTLGVLTKCDNVVTRDTDIFFAVGPP